MDKEKKEMVGRYNIGNNMMEYGYWVGTTFKIVYSVPAT